MPLLYVFSVSIKFQRPALSIFCKNLAVPSSVVLNHSEPLLCQPSTLVGQYKCNSNCWVRANLRPASGKSCHIHKLGYTSISISSVPYISHVNVILICLYCFTFVCCCFFLFSQFNFSAHENNFICQHLLIILNYLLLLL